MSIFGKKAESDSSYPLSVLAILQGVKRWFEEGGNANSLQQLHAVLRMMAVESPAPNVLGKEKFKYRRPVWKLIGHNLRVTKTTKPISPKRKAKLLIGQLSLCVQYQQYEGVLENFRKEVKNLGFSFRLNPPSGFLNWDVVVMEDIEKKGKNARKIVKGIVDVLIPALEEHIKKTQG